MDDKRLIDSITQALAKLEEQGELVLTTTSPDGVARAVFDAALRGRFTALDSDAPIECTIPHLLELTVAQVEARFGVNPRRAREIVNRYYNGWLATRSMTEIAEIYWHETPREMAARAYYHIELGQPDNRDLNYSDWRQRLAR